MLIFVCCVDVCHLVRICWSSQSAAVLCPAAVCGQLQVLCVQLL